MKTLAKAAIDQINEQNQKNAEAKAIFIIKDISGLLENVSARETDIEHLQDQLDQLANSELTLSKVLGKPMPAALTVTQTTIAKSIEALVKSKQACVESRAINLGEQIICSTKAIESLNEALAKKRKELEELKVEVVVESDVLNA